jgi:hypothetical protein
MNAKRLEARSDSKFDAVCTNGANLRNFRAARSFTAELERPKIAHGGT